MALRHSQHQFPPIELVIDEEDMQSSLSTFDFSLFEDSNHSVALSSLVEEPKLPALGCSSRWEVQVSEEFEESQADCALKIPRRQHTIDSKTGPSGSPTDVALKVPKRQQTKESQAMKYALQHQQQRNKLLAAPPTAVKRSRSAGNKSGGRQTTAKNSRIPRRLRNSHPTTPTECKGLQELVEEFNKEDYIKQIGQTSSHGDSKQDNSSPVEATEQQQSGKIQPTWNITIKRTGTPTILEEETTTGETSSWSPKSSSTGGNFLSRRMGNLIRKALALEASPELLQEDSGKVTFSLSGENLGGKSLRDLRPRLPHRNLTRDDLRR